jgi:hypothetical protein
LGSGVCALAVSALHIDNIAAAAAIRNNRDK